MKLMVSLLLLVGIWHAAETSGSIREDVDPAAVKRMLQEGNFGMKIQPSVELAFPNLPVEYNDNKNELREGPPQKEYGPPTQEYGSPKQQYGVPRQPVKISDVLAGQGAFPAVIQSHLYSPMQVYQPRLGSPTTFDVSQPVPSQLAYSEHKIYQATPTIPTIQELNEDTQALNQNAPSQWLDQQQPPRPALPNEFLPRFDGPMLSDSGPDFRQQIYQQVFSQQSGAIPQDINQLGNQIIDDTRIQEYQRSIQGGNTATENPGQQPTQNAEIQYAKRTEISNQQGLKNNKQEIESQQQSVTQQPQAVSYASFSRSLPLNSQSPYQYQSTQSSTLPPQQQERQLPQRKSPALFQPLQTTRAQSTFQSIATTPLQSTIYTKFNQTPHHIGIENIRHRQETTTPQTSISKIEPQESSTTTVVTATDNYDSQSTTAHQQSQSTRFSTPVPSQSRPTTSIRSFTRSNLTPRSTKQPRAFASRPTLPSLSVLNRRQQTTLQTFSTSPSSTLPQYVNVQSLPTIPPQLDIQTISTLPPTTPLPQLIRSTLTSIPLFQHQQKPPTSYLPQYSSRLQHVQPQATTIQPLLTSLQPNLPGIITLGQRYGVPQSNNQVLDYNSQEKSQQQLSQLSPQPPQLQPQYQSQQIQHQLEAIQQQLQVLQQQPPFIHQRPQPNQIIQQQTTPFPHSLQLIQQQQPIYQEHIQQKPQPSPASQLQQVQLIQQEPQPSPIPQIQPYLIQKQGRFPQSQPQPQLVQPQSLLIAPQPPLLQPQSQLVLPQPTPIQSTQLQLEPTPRTPIELQQQPLQEKENHHSQKQENSENQAIKISTDSEFHNQLDNLQNSLYSEELLIQQQPLIPVSVAFRSYPAAPSLLSPLHSSYLHSPYLHSSHLLSPHIHNPSLNLYHSTHSFPSAQYYGKHSPGIYGVWK